MHHVLRLINSLHFLAEFSICYLVVISLHSNRNNISFCFIVFLSICLILNIINLWCSLEMVFLTLFSQKRRESGEGTKESGRISISTALVLLQLLIVNELPVLLPFSAHSLTPAVINYSTNVIPHSLFLDFECQAIEWIAFLFKL